MVIGLIQCASFYNMKHETFARSTALHSAQLRSCMFILKYLQQAQLHAAHLRSCMFISIQCNCVLVPVSEPGGCITKLQYEEKINLLNQSMQPLFAKAILIHKHVFKLLCHHYLAFNRVGIMQYCLCVNHTAAGLIRSLEGGGWGPNKVIRGGWGPNKGTSRFGRARLKQIAPLTS